MFILFIISIETFWTFHFVYKFHTVTIIDQKLHPDGTLKVHFFSSIVSFFYAQSEAAKKKNKKK